MVVFLISKNVSAVKTTPTFRPHAQAAIDQVTLESRLDKLFCKNTQIMKKAFCAQFCFEGEEAEMWSDKQHSAGTKGQNIPK